MSVRFDIFGFGAERHVETFFIVIVIIVTVDDDSVRIVVIIVVIVQVAADRATAAEVMSRGQVLVGSIAERTSVAIVFRTERLALIFAVLFLFLQASMHASFHVGFELERGQRRMAHISVGHQRERCKRMERVQPVG